jgi:putative intracellular protease/amidase
VERDGRIITGQNFQSSRGVALKIIEALESSN